MDDEEDVGGLGVDGCVGEGEGQVCLGGVCVAEVRANEDAVQPGGPAAVLMLVCICYWIGL